MCLVRTKSPGIFQQAINFEELVDDKVAAHSRCYLLFCDGIRSERAAQSRLGSGEAKGANGVQTRWNGPRHEAMGW
jgi:hypothetical protein